jgi:8-oxo-dGTP diphosphatase
VGDEGVDRDSGAEARGVRRVVLCFVLRDVQRQRCVLLGRKKRGFGRGKVVGLGGHLLTGESERAAAVREVAEESSLTVDPGDLLAAGGVLFTFPARPDWDMQTTVFVASRWGGVPMETEEIAPRWYGVDALPFDVMWSDAAAWIPDVLAGHAIDGTVVYGADNQAMVSHDLRRVGPLGRAPNMH